MVEVLSDNMTTVSCINKQGGTHSLLLCRLALDLWDWCDHHQITISAVHLAGESNILADALSRGNYCPTEWTLHRPTFMSLWQVWDQPFVDMFASAQNAQLLVYYCLGSDPQASGSNALAINAAYRDLSAEERRELGVRAYDTRGVGASWALLTRVPIQEIMDAAS